MSTPFQNRLVGTIIVAAAIVIFLPDILDGKKKSNQADFDAIPQAPTFTGTVSTKAFPEEDLVLKEQTTIFNEEAKDDQLLTESHKTLDKQDANISEEIEKLDDQAAKVTPASKPKNIEITTSPKTDKNTSAIKKSMLGQQPDKAINKEAWAIQLGSFKNQSNVEELVDKLKANGYSVFTKPIQTRKGILTKVFVGPELIKASLSKEIPALKKLTNVEGKVARFYPNQ